MKRRKFLNLTVATSALGVSSAHTFAKKEKKPFVVKNGEARFGIHTPYRGINPNDLKVSGKDTNGQLAIYEYIGKQKVGPDLHVHLEQDEIFTVLEGEYKFQIGDEKILAKAGDTLFGPKGIPHTWIQTTETGKLMYMVQPAGKFEEFFIKLTELKGPPSQEYLDKLSLEHGIKNLGPALTLD
ncbi:MAG: cupin domain-containing protein [Bacteroidota bacterium]